MMHKPFVLDVVYLNVDGIAATSAGDCIYSRYCDLYIINIFQARSNLQSRGEEQSWVVTRKICTDSCHLFKTSNWNERDPFSWRAVFRKTECHFSEHSQVKSWCSWQAFKSTLTFAPGKIQPGKLRLNESCPMETGTLGLSNDDA